MAYDYSHPQHKAARAEAMARSGGVCQLCGQRPAVEGHHWKYGRYKPPSETTADDLTGLCHVCHEIATTLRRFRGDIWTFMSCFRESVAETYESGRW